MTKYNELLKEIKYIVVECIEHEDERTIQYARLHKLLDKFNQLVKAVK
ncbi:hypothetical protein [Clostridium sp.]